MRDPAAIEVSLEPAGSSTEIARRIRQNAGMQGDTLYSLKTSMERALWVLAFGKDYSGNDVMTPIEICEVLHELEVAAEPREIINALNRADDKVIYEDFESPDEPGGFKITQVGRTFLAPKIDRGDIEVWYAEPDSRWRANKRLAELSGLLEGPLDILDPYYGERTLIALDTLSQRAAPVRFLSQRTTESESKVRLLLRDLSRSRPNLKVRLVEPGVRDLHDRYILSPADLVLVGQGIKDLGARESFVIRLPASMAPDMVSRLRSTFERRWDSANPIER